jgi:hypothetical protein
LLRKFGLRSTDYTRLVQRREFLITTQPVKELYSRKLTGPDGDWRVRLATTLSSLYRLPSKYFILDVSQTFEPLRSVKGIVLQILKMHYVMCLLFIKRRKSIFRFDLYVTRRKVFLGF